MAIFDSKSKVKLEVVKNMTKLDEFVPPAGFMGTIRLCNADTKKQTNSWLIVSEGLTLDISALESSDMIAIDKAFEDHVRKSPARALSNFGPRNRKIIVDENGVEIESNINIFYSAIWLPDKIVSKYI